MDTNRLRRFATEARNVLMQGVSQRLAAAGFNVDGTFAEEPQLYEGGATFMGNIVSEDFYKKWKSLQHAIELKSAKEVVEEAAYTWFNRFMAIHILARNGLVEPVLNYEAENIRVPLIVKDARQGRLPQMDKVSLEKIRPLLQDDAKTNEQFRELIVAFCHATPIINKCFGRITDYTELLLPTNILASGNFVDMLNHTEYISEEDYRSPELIGWLYQFYISERKAKVMAKKGKYNTDEIPAVTQIFTPNWIVKYMVQNTLGRIFLDNNPSEADTFKKKWQYLVEQSEPTPADAIYRYNELTDLKMADLACGSGHILNEYFDILFDLYRHEGYNAPKAINNIFTRNLIGIDIDTRAKQLATFALLLKACQRDRSFADAHCMPRIYDMPKPYEDKNSLRKDLSHFLMGGNEEMITQLTDAIKLMDKADTLGSIMKFDISERTRNTIVVRMEEYEQSDFIPEQVQKLMPYMNIILALTEKYASLVMNPPYMGSSKMNGVLSQYANDNYPISKNDLFAMFIDRSMQLVVYGGRVGLITMESWMFLSSYKKFRKHILDNYYISSLGHFGWKIIGIEFGTAMTIFENAKSESRKGEYSYLTIDDIDREINVPFVYPKKDNGRYAIISQQNFKKIPGSPIGYWVSDMVLNCFDAPSLGESVDIPQGLITSDNDRFLRFWAEVSKKNICVTCERTEDTYSVKWYPYCKGGGFRKWYGLLEMVVNWKDDGVELKNFCDKNGKQKSRTQNVKYYFKEGITYNSITSGKPSLRYMKNCIFGGGGNGLFSDNDILSVLGFLNTNLANYLLDILNPTINVLVGDIVSLPKKYNDSFLTEIVEDCIAISKSDWDAHETSWDFTANELVASCQGHTLEEAVSAYKSRWEKKFHQLHANEEELNRQFIEIYGLQDELTPEVPLSEVTILQQGEISIVEGAKGEELRWNDDVLIKQLISYAVGCMMGRYSIDKPGLILANQGEGLERYNELVPDSRFDVDGDCIIPLMSNNNEFTDNATMRFKKWLSVTFGEDKLTQNLNYIEQCLGKTIDTYFVRDFWNDHIKMYQNRPIYWLFSSKRKTFQCIVYMHRMDAYTVGHLRTRYLLPHIEWLMNKQREMAANESNLSTRERNELSNLTKQIEECREYEERLYIVADKQIAIDLDDGVVVNYAKYGDVLAKIK